MATRGTTTAKSGHADTPASPGDSQEAFRAPQVCNLLGITYRQLDYWARTGLVEPSIAATRGRGERRLYTFNDLVFLKIVKRLLDTGMSLRQIRTVLDILMEQQASDVSLDSVTILSDGRSLYVAHSAEEVMDVFGMGQGVFGIAVGPVQTELEHEIRRLFQPLESVPTEPREVEDPVSSRYINRVAERVRDLLVDLESQRKAAGETLTSLGDEDTVAERLVSSVPSLSEWDERIGPFYTTRKVASLLGGVSRQAVADRRKRGSILGLKTSDGIWIHPSWQFLDNGKIRPGVRDLVSPFAREGVDGWETAGWLESTFKKLGGFSPRQALESGTGDTAKLAEMAERAAGRLGR